VTAIDLYKEGVHRNVFLEDQGGEEFVQANQHLIIHERQGLLLDPGGHKVYPAVLRATLRELDQAMLRHIFLSHQDPDVVAAINGWLMTTDADAHVPAIWQRFVPHFGMDQLVRNRLHPIPDEGMQLELGGATLLIIPAHFLHSAGNHQLYDPISKILYSGDLGASPHSDLRTTRDFAPLEEQLRPFHERYLACNTALRAWVRMVRQLDIETIAPQHGTIMQGRDCVESFLSWCEELRCGVDLLAERYVLPQFEGSGA
jgi:flavorubredoxin